MKTKLWNGHILFLNILLLKTSKVKTGMKQYLTLPMPLSILLLNPNGGGGRLIQHTIFSQYETGGVYHP